MCIRDRLKVCCVLRSNNVCSQIVYTVYINATEPLGDCTNCKTSITLAGLIGHTIKFSVFYKVKTLFGDTSCNDYDIVTSCCLASLSCTDSLVRVICKNDSI